MSDINVKVGASDDGFSRLIQGLQAQLERLAAASRQLTRDQLADARAAVEAARAVQRQREQALRETIQAGKDAVAQEREASRERIKAAKSSLDAEREQLRITKENAVASLEAVRTTAAAHRRYAQETTEATRARRDADVSAARDQLRGAVEQARATREAGREAVRAAQEEGQRSVAAFASTLRARVAATQSQREEGRNLIRATRDQVREEVDAARQIVQANVQRTRELRAQFRQQIADAKKAVEEKKRALAEAQDSPYSPRPQEQALAGARSRLATIREARDTVLGGASDDVANARNSAEAVKQAGREKIAAAQAVARAVNDEAQANIRAGVAAVQAAKESSAAKIESAKRASDAANAAAAQEVRAARQILDDQVRAGKISVTDAERQLKIANEIATAKIEGAKRALAAAVAAGEGEVNVARRTLAATIDTSQERVRAAERSAAAATREQRSLLQNAKLVTEEARAKFSAINATRAGSAARNAGLAAIKLESNAISGLIGYLQKLAVQYGALRLLSAFTREGLDFNRTLETATLGIGALITAEAKLTDATGRELKGREALGAAMAISEGQMQKLRIAGLQTSATTEELVKAMQQAVGPGLAAGGSIDQIRGFTIQLTQAAGAIGLPFHQLNEEVRSLLAGTINYNTRIAKSLGITNAMVKEWKNQGVLFEKLNERFAAFNVAGERSLTTFATLKSNLTEALQVFAGASVKPFFESLKTEGSRALNSLFNFDTGKIAHEFEGIVTALQDVFAAAGRFSGDVIEKMIGGAKELSRWLEENRTQVGGVIDALEEVVKQVFAIIGALVGSATELTRAHLEAGRLEQALRAVARVLEVIAKYARVVFFFPNLILQGLGKIQDLFDRTEQNVEGVARAMENLRAATRDTAVETNKLAFEYADIDKKIKSGALTGISLQNARQRQAALLKEIIHLNPQMKAALSNEAAGSDALAASIKNLAAQRVYDLGVQRAQLEATLNAQRAQLRTLDRSIQASTDVGDTESVKKLTESYNKLADTFNETKTSAIAADNAIQEISQAQASYEIKVTPNAAEVDKDDKEARKRDARLQKLADAYIKTITKAQERFKAAADLSLERGEISYAQYYDDLAKMETKSVNDRIKIREAQQKKTVDPTRKEAIGEQIKQLEEERGTIEDRYRKERYEKERELAEAIDGLRAQSLTLDNETAFARRAELEKQFGQLRRTLLAQNTEESKAGIVFLDHILNVEYARARIDEMQKVITDGQQSLTVEIDRLDILHSQGAIDATDQTKQLSAAYEEQIKIIEDMLPALREAARITGDDATIIRVRELENELQRLKIVQREVSSLAIEVGHAARRGLEEGLTALISSIGEESATIKSMLKDLALSVLRAMNDVLAPKIAQTITHAIMQAFSDLGSSAAGEFAASFIRVLAQKMRGALDSVLGPIVDAVGGIFGRRRAPAPAPSSVPDGAGVEIGPIGAGKTGMDPTEIFEEATKMGTPTASSAGAMELAAAQQMSLASATMTSAVAQFMAAVVQFSTAATVKGAADTGATIAKLSSIAGSAFGSPQRFADGGQVGGVSPHPRADDKLIFATAKEFIHPVPAVEYYGPQFMEAIRRRAIPQERTRILMREMKIPALAVRARGTHFADGGSVTVSAQRSGVQETQRASNSRVDVMLHSNDSHIVRVMESSAGVRAQIKTVQRNQKTINGVLQR